MKKGMNKIISPAAALTAVVLLQSCAMDTPFGGGDGNLSINTTINGEVTKTRAVPANYEELANNCVVYIENSRGVMRKYKGLSTIPSNISLSTGTYVCNAWTGDSVPASFSSKFYRGKQDFEISENQTTSLQMKCNIANVVASVDAASVASVGLKDAKITFSTPRGSLEFTEANFASDKGYFMTPSPETKANDEAAYAEQTTLTVKIEGTKDDGTSYSKTTQIKNVQRTHEYNVNLTKDEQHIEDGGALIKIVIKDIPIIEDDVTIFPAPVMKGVGFDIADQVVNLDGTFKDTKVYICGYYGLNKVLMNVSSNFTDLDSGVDILSPTVAESLETKGIVVERHEAVDAETGVMVDELYVTFKASYLNALAKSGTEYAVTFDATDNKGRAGEAKVRFANDEAAVEKIDDVTSDAAPTTSADPAVMDVTYITLSGKLYNAGASSYGFKYREAGTSEWQTAVAGTSNGKPAKTRATSTSYSVVIKGLKGGTVYEYKAFADDFESEIVQTFKTMAPYEIPNRSMEDWSTYQAKTMLGEKTVIFPGLGNAPTFWDSGNEGGATANKILTNKSTDMKHSGSYSARLASDEAMGVLAAGNLFVGDYVETDGTNGVLALGRPYNGTRPVKLRVWVNYRPGTVDIIKKGNESHLGFAKGDLDHGQIYVALSDGVVDIRTNPKNQKLFNPNDEQILAYNQVTWTENVGADGELVMIEIPFIYNERSTHKRATHLLVTCCASKFGDFFSGSSKSVMYLDDFELVYE